MSSRNFLKLLTVIALIATERAKAAESLIDRAPSLDSLPELLALPPPSGEWEQLQAEHQRAISIFNLTAKSRTTLPAFTQWQVTYKLSNQLLNRALYIQKISKSRYTVAYDNYFIGDAAPPPPLDQKADLEVLLRALEHLRDIAENTHSRSRRDEINFLIASTLARVGNEHCETYFKLLTERPTSNVWVLLGKTAYADYLAANEHFDKAITNYRSILATDKLPQPSTDLSPSIIELKAYTTYRLSWTIIAKNWQKNADIRANAFTEASQLMKSVVEIMHKDDKDRKHRLDLGKEATQDLLWLWATLDKDVEAKKFIVQSNQPELIEFYREYVVLEAINRKNFDLAKSTIDIMLTENTKSDIIPDLILRLARAYSIAGDSDAASNESKRLVTLSSDPQSSWYQFHKNHPETLTRVQRMIELLPLSSVMSLVRAADSEVDPSRKIQLLTRSVAELEKFLKTSNSHPQSGVIRLALASALMQLDRKKDALRELDTLYAVKDQDESQLQAIATERLNLVIKLDAGQTYPRLPEPGEVKRPIPLPDLKQRFALYAEDYLKFFPGDAQALPLQFQIAQNLFLYGHYDDALSKFESLVNHYPNSEQAKVAIEVLLSMNVKRARWDELIRLSTAFLNNRAVKGKSLRDYVKQNLDYARSQKR